MKHTQVKQKSIPVKSWLENLYSKLESHTTSEEKLIFIKNPPITVFSGIPQV